MAEVFEATFNARELRRRLRVVPRGIHGALADATRKELARFQGSFTERRLSGASASSLGRRTGTLARALTHEVKGDRLERLRGRVYFDSTHITVGPGDTTYAHVHEFGATIVPRRAKALTIPLAAALTPAGVQRRPSARDWPDTFISGGLIYQRRGPQSVVPLYALRQSVRLEPKLNFRRDWNRNRPTFSRGVARSLSRFVAEWNRNRGNTGGIVPRRR